MSIKKTKPHFNNEFFEEIDTSANKNNYFSPILQEVSKIIDYKNSKILDVGCGTGIFLESIIKDGANNCFGVDGPSKFVKRAKERGYKDIFIIDDLCNTSMPFKNESFDFILCKDVFEHLIDPIFTLHEIKRVLKKDGYFLFHVPNHFPLYGRLKFLLSNDIDTFHFFKAESRWTFPHIRFYEYYDCIDTLSKNGFLLVNDLSYYFSAFPELRRFKFIHPILNYFMKKYPNQFTYGYTFLLKKVNN
jgi:SAM-dependent methyltransferase